MIRINFRNISLFWGFPGSSAGKESVCRTGDLGSIPELVRFPGEGNLYPRHYSGQENSMDCIVHGVTKSPTQLSDFCFSSVGSSLLCGLFVSCKAGASYVVWASCCDGFFSCRAWTLEHRLNSCGLGLIALWHVGSSRSVSPALAGGFFTTEPPGKPLWIEKTVKWCKLLIDKV